MRQLLVSALALILLAPSHIASAQRIKELTIVSYNAENLFSPWYDTIKNPDREYTPSGTKHWTHRRLREKNNRLADAIAGCSGHAPPAIVGLCEVEDRSVLRKLVTETHLASVEYKIIHRDSPDPRGIDVALIYDAKQVKRLAYRWISPLTPDSLPMRSREILYAAFLLPYEDTLHVFQNHWPSKFSGVIASTARREAARTVLMDAIDSIRKREPTAKIIAMGDFNEEPDNLLFTPLASPNVDEAEQNGLLVNLMHPTRKVYGAKGSHKYLGVWSTIDLFFVSPSVVKGESGWRLKKGSPLIANPSYLLETDLKHGGVRPKRTYLGPRYHGGTSDHLPIVLRLSRKRH